AEEDYLRHVLGELEWLDPKPGEHEALQAERQTLMSRDRLVEAINGALSDLAGAKPVEAALRSAYRQLERISAKAGGALDQPMAAIDRTLIELSEALRQLEAIGRSIESNAQRLQQVDDRLFAMRDLARKHRVDIADLPALRRDIAARLAAIADDS